MLFEDRATSVRLRMPPTLRRSGFRPHLRSRVYDTFIDSMGLMSGVHDKDFAMNWVGRYCCSATATDIAEKKSMFPV